MFALILLPIGAIYAASVNGLFDGDPVPPVDLGAGQPIRQQVVEEKPSLEDLIPKDLKVEISKVKSRGWIRNPFASPKEEIKVRKMPDKFVEPLPKLNMELIFFNGKEYVVTIEGKVYKRRDKIGIESVAFIGKDHVILKSNRGKRTLFLTEQSFSFEVEESSDLEEDSE
ncbi:hypothetical protein WDW89_15365 [Deltaproteobacteria bacterium TL4]